MPNRPHNSSPTRPRRTSAWWALCSVALLTTGPAVGQDLDELLGIPDSGEPKSSESEPAPPRDESNAQADVKPDDEKKPIDLNEQVEERLSGEEAADAFEKAVTDMGEVARKLGRDYDPGRDTTRLQQEILDRLDAIIKSASQSGGGGGGGGGQTGSARDAESGQGQAPSAQQGQPGPPRQAQSSSPGGANPNEGTPSVGAVGSDGSEVTMQDLRDGNWGNLPDRLRHELTDSLDEAFSPAYRRQTQDYYLRIAETLRAADSP